MTVRPWRIERARQAVLHAPVELVRTFQEKPRRLLRLVGKYRSPSLSASGIRHLVAVGVVKRKYPNERSSARQDARFGSPKQADQPGNVALVSRPAKRNEPVQVRLGALTKVRRQARAIAAASKL
jgi:hypothetical protein